MAVKKALSIRIFINGKWENLLNQRIFKDGRWYKFAKNCGVNKDGTWYVL